MEFAESARCYQKARAAMIIHCGDFVAPFMLKELDSAEIPVTVFLETMMGISTCLLNFLSRIYQILHCTALLEVLKSMNLKLDSRIRGSLGMDLSQAMNIK